MVNGKCLAIVALLLCLATSVNLQIAQAEPAEVHPADSMWVEPSTIDLSTYAVGDKFNVTVWVNITSQNMYTWQFKLYYDTSLLTAVRAGYTGPDGACSEWATYKTGGSTAAVSPVIEENYVLFCESIVGEAWVPAGTCASLAWVEFQVVAAPPTGLESTLDIDNEDTYVLNYDLEEITLTKHSTAVIPEFPSIAYMIITLVVSVAITIALRKHLHKPLKNCGKIGGSLNG